MATKGEAGAADRITVPLLSADRGLSLVEIVVAMFLLALVSIAFLPLLINSLQLSIRNATISTATQVLNGQLDALAATAPTCAAVTAYGSAALPATTDRRNVTYQPVRSVPACNTLTFPATISVDLEVRLTGTTVNDVGITTTVLLQEAG